MSRVSVATRMFLGTTKNAKSWKQMWCSRVFIIMGTLAPDVSVLHGCFSLM